MSRKIVRQGVRSTIGRIKGQVPVPKRKKVNEVLRHSMHSLKKVARLPNQDRVAVMKFLKKNERKFQGSSKLKKAVTMISKDLSEETSSSSSVNNDLKHWMVLHGSEKVVREDVRLVGDTIGVQLGGCKNMFGVLAKKGKGKKKGSADGEEVVGGRLRVLSRCRGRRW